MSNKPLYLPLFMAFLIAATLSLGSCYWIAKTYNINIIILFVDTPRQSAEETDSANKTKTVVPKADTTKQATTPKSAVPKTIAYKTLEVDPYPFGFDPISGEQLPEEAIVFVEQNREYRFASKANLEKFQEAPWELEPKFDAWIKTMQEKRIHKTCVVMSDRLVDDPDVSGPFDTVYGNRLYQLCCHACVHTFEAQPQEYINKINKWNHIDQRDHERLYTCPVTKANLKDAKSAIYYMLHHHLVAFKDEAAFQTYLKNPAKYLPTDIKFE